MNDTVAKITIQKENHVLQQPLTLAPQIGAFEAGWWERSDPTRTWFSLETYLEIKRVVDLSVIILSLPVTLPVLLICALFIKLFSPGGPVFFKQERTGKGGKRFLMYKFRTMVPNAEEMKAELANLNEFTWPDFKITNDPRVTRIGKFLRKTSLDEAPQILNILKGEMSLVGPRPTSFHGQTYQLWQTERLDVIPGLTGLWQIIGRGSLDFDERVRLDVAYIQYRSLLLDLEIFLKTIAAVIERRGAH